MDFEIHCDKGFLTFTKMKDAEPPEPVPFRLRPVPIGETADGETLTSCVVEYGERSAVHKEDGVRGFDKMLLDMVKASPGVFVGDLRLSFYEKREQLDPNVSRNTIKNSFNGSFDRLAGKGLLDLRDNRVHPANDNPSSVTYPSFPSQMTARVIPSSVISPYKGDDEVTPADDTREEPQLWN